MYRYDELIEFYCPVCKTELVVSEDKIRYEILDDHVCNPNGTPPLRHYMLCPNKDCEAQKFDVFWDRTGDVYVGDYSSHITFESKCIDYIDAPFGSLARRQAIEIYKKGVKDKIYLHPLITFYIIRLYIQYYYKADTDGNVLSKSWKIKFLKRDNGRFSIIGSWWLSTFKFLWREFQRNKKFKKSMNRRFPYRAFEFVIYNILYYKSYKKYLKEQADNKPLRKKR